MRKKKREQSLSQIVSHYVLNKRVGKLSKKDLTIIIDGYEFEFNDIHLSIK